MTKPQENFTFERKVLYHRLTQKEKRARRLIAHQRYVVWHRNYDECMCSSNIILKYFINARNVPPYFIPDRNVPPCLGVTGTVQGGTTIFHYCEKITAIFRSTGNRRNRYRQKMKYREPPKKYRQVEILHRMCPPKKTVPRNTLKYINRFMKEKRYKQRNTVANGG